MKAGPDRGPAPPRGVRVDLESLADPVRRHERRGHEGAERTPDRASRSCWPRPSSTRRCSRSWLRETSDPGAPPAGRGGPPEPLRGLRASGLCPGRPAPLHPALRSPPDPRRRGETPPSPASDRSSRTHAGAGRRRTRSSSARAGRSTAKRTRLPLAHRGPAAPPALSQGPSAGHLERERRSANRPNEVWAFDFQFDETADYRRLKLTNIVDEFTREALPVEVNSTTTSEEVVAVSGAPGGRARREGVTCAWTTDLSWCLAPEGLLPPLGYRHHVHRAGLSGENP